MMKKLILFGFMMMLGGLVYSQQFIADYTVAKEEVLRSIPKEVIDQARNNFHMVYWHTSHGTHVTRGMMGLQNYKSGDNELFGTTIDNKTTGKLDIRDEYGLDLSVNMDIVLETTRAFLDNPANADINIVMWSWCSISGKDIDAYFSNFETLISEYGKDGSKIGTGPGQREEPVYFIFMTGHAVSDGGNLKHTEPEEQAGLINDYCNEHGYFCLDYYSIDTHDMDDNYWDDATDNAVSAKYHTAGGVTDNFYQDWQNSHTLGEDWFNGKNSKGNVNPGTHVTQHITCNRKAYAMWWILARLTGWEDTPTAIDDDLVKKNDIIYDHRSKLLIIKDADVITDDICRIYNLTGILYAEKQIKASVLSLSDLQKGLYIISLNTSKGIITKKILITE